MELVRLVTVTTSAAALSLALANPAAAQYPPGEGPALDPNNRITQNDIIGGGLSLTEIRSAGMAIFATPFNKFDGYGDGPVDHVDTTSPGRRPTLQDNGTFLRINGLDAQNCQECHSVGSNQTVPYRYELGGVGHSNNNAIFQPKNIDVDDSDGVGHASFDGRYINPPFLFGMGGVEKVGREMTSDLRLIQRAAYQKPGVWFPLDTHGVNFGEIRWLPFIGPGQGLDTSRIEGVDPDLVVRPLGRKGDMSTARAFDTGALQFHLGMQPVEVVGQGVDGDGDGVVDEILIGELSALHIFDTNLEPPTQDPLSPSAANGSVVFTNTGCARCHIPFIDVADPVLNYSFPQVEDNPNLNIYYSVDLSTPPTNFALNQQGGIRVPMFSDLKRHDMGPELAEDFGDDIDAEFITARLWGIADTAPYLHDGRALTLTDAILMHGGDAQTERDNFAALPDAQKLELLDFLRTLRTPVGAGTDLY